MNKLPAWRLARHAYLDVVANAQGLLQVGGLWLLLSWALMMLGRTSPVLGVAADVVVAVGAAAIAVAWHRHILENEPLTARMAPVDGRVARYFAFTVILAFVVGLLPLAVLLLTTREAGELRELGLESLLVPALMLACIYVAMRLQLVFPATAIGDQGLTPARSWAITEGNGWRLVMGFFLATMPVALVVLGVALGLSWVADVTGSIALAALVDLAAVGNAWLQAPLIASFLSYAYIFFTRQSSGLLAQ
jgi:hypothetical protein